MLLYALACKLLTSIVGAPFKFSGPLVAIFKINLVEAIGFPINNNPPKSLVSSAKDGCVNEPPPTIANCFANKFGKEYCCPERYIVPSITPEVNEFPNAT